MNVKAIIPQGWTGITVNGLHQWDRGQVLEIESADIKTETVEVHFACKSMAEAIVRPCSFINGIGTVSIPDQCLEQTAPISAWIYRTPEASQGYTAVTITLPIIARPRPGAPSDVLPIVVDRYTELIEEVNKTVGALTDGSVTAKNAIQAENATTADNALQAQTLKPFFDGESTHISCYQPGLYLVAAEYSGQHFTGMVSVPSFDDMQRNFIGDRIDCSPRFGDDYEFIISFECIPNDGIFVRCPSSFNGGYLPIKHVICLAKYNT